MTNKELRYVKGSVVSGQAADIYLYTDVENWSAEYFVEEFKYLVDAQPSEIRVHINSTGGCAISGIGIFTLIMDCPIHVVCINDGLAASIASIIWAAGDERKMRDYALLMIHNPFLENSKETPSTEAMQIIDAFTKQLAIIYKTRFLLSDEEVKSIMDGQEGHDGTFFTANEAVEKGFITKDEIISTPNVVHEKVAAELKGIKDNRKIIDIMTLVLDSENTETENNAIIEKETKIFNNSNIENAMSKEWTVVATLLGISSEKATEDSITSHIGDLKAKVAKFDEVSAELVEVKKSLDTANTELSGAKATITNLQNDLSEAKKSLATYQAAEEAARQAAIEAMVKDAIESCKISKESEQDWLKMAKNDLQTTKRVLDAIPARENIGKKIADDEANKGASQEGLKDVEAEIKEKVESVVGKDFKFRTIE